MTAADDPHDDFAATRWSLVLGAGDADPGTAHASMLTLCLRYWYPVYAYLRRSGHRADRAHDLALAFFARLLRDGIGDGDAARHGRFRLFVLAELHRFLSADHDGAPRLDPQEAPPLDEMEARHQAEARAQGSPEEILRRGFVVEVRGAAHRRLRREAAESGHVEMFEALERFLGTEPMAGEYESIAQRLGVRPLFVSMAVKRLRQRFRELVDRELGETLAGPGEMDAERSALMQALGGQPA
jgi:hypothetical protein